MLNCSLFIFKARKADTISRINIKKPFTAKVGSSHSFPESEQFSFKIIRQMSEHCCCLVAKLCLTLCNPVDCSTPGFPVLHYLKLMFIKLVMPFNHLILCHPLLLLSSIFPSIRVFLMSQFFTSGGQSIGASVSSSVLPMNIQD